MLWAAAGESRGNPMATQAEASALGAAMQNPPHCGRIIGKVWREAGCISCSLAAAISKPPRRARGGRLFTAGAGALHAA